MLTRVQARLAAVGKAAAGVRPCLRCTHLQGLRLWGARAQLYHCSWRALRDCKLQGCAPGELLLNMPHHRMCLLLQVEAPPSLQRGRVRSLRALVDATQGQL